MADFVLATFFTIQPFSMMQLIFIDPKHTSEDSKRFFTFYRIFVLPSTEEITTKEEFSLIKVLSPGFNSSTLILHYDKANDQTYINWVPINDYDAEEWRPVSIDSQEKDLFDRTFGEYKQKRLTAVNTIEIRKDTVDFLLSFDVNIHQFNILEIKRIQTAIWEKYCVWDIQ